LKDCVQGVYERGAGIFKIRDLLVFLREAKKELFLVCRSVFNQNFAKNHVRGFRAREVFFYRELQFNPY